MWGRDQGKEPQLGQYPQYAGGVVVIPFLAPVMGSSASAGPHSRAAVKELGLGSVPGRGQRWAAAWPKANHRIKSQVPRTYSSLPLWDPGQMKRKALVSLAFVTSALEGSESWSVSGGDTDTGPGRGTPASLHPRLASHPPPHPRQALAVTT